MEIDLRELVERYGVMVSSICHKMIQDKELVKDAAQEVCYEVVKSIHSFKEESELSTWVYTIAKRTVIKFSKNERIPTIRELKIFRALPEIECSDYEENKHEWIKERCDWCLNTLNHCLSNDARLIFIFKINIGLSYKQISEIMEMKEDNVRQISSRSITKISNFMNDTCPLYNPKGTCKCRISKYIEVDLKKEYSSVKRIIRLVDLYQRLDKELPRKNYWERILN